MIFNVLECVCSYLLFWTSRSRLKVLSWVSCTLWILLEYLDFTGEESCCKQRAGPQGAACCGRHWLQPPGASCLLGGISSIWEQGAGSVPEAWHPAEWSQCHSSSWPSQRGSREQFYGPHSVAVSLLNFMWAALGVLRPAALASLHWPPASGLLGLVSHLSFSLCSLQTLGWKKMKDFCSRSSKSHPLLSVPMLHDLVAITRNAWKAFSLVDRLSLCSCTDIEHIFVRAACA